MTDGWISQQDPDSGQEFYYNTFTGQSSWTWPPEGLDMNSARGQYYNEGQYDTNDPYYQDTIVDGSVGRGPKKMSPKWVRALNKVRAAVSMRAVAPQNSETSTKQNQNPPNLIKNPDCFSIQC